VLEAIEWKEEKRRIRDLKPHTRNPRRITKEMFQILVTDIKTFGYHNRIRITKDNIIISGHQRLRALLDPSIGYKKTSEIKVLVAPRDLTEEEFKAEIIKDNLHSGDWDFDVLSSDYDAQELVSYGLPESILGVLDCDEESDEIEPTPKKKAKLCKECGAEQ
jgi:ParB-like chromosome segregation protein Spo0J